MYDRAEDEQLTSQDHEAREWRPRDVILIGLALFVLAVLVFLCASIPVSPGGINGF